MRATGEVWSGLPPSSLATQDVPESPLPFPSVLSLRRLLRKFRPDVVHAHWLPFATLALLAGARPLVATAWGSDVYGAGRRHRLAARVTLRRAALATADSADLVRRLEELRSAPGRTLLVNWGVDLEVFRMPSADERAALKARHGLGPGPVIFSPRGLKELYNPAVVVKAFARVRALFPDAQLVLKHAGGEASLPSGWSEMPGVQVVGHVDRRTIVDLFRAADVTVSIPDSDSSPRSVWEAMAAGSATVLSDLPWVHELIADDRDALVVSPDDDAVAAAIERLLRDEPLRERVTVSARDLVERHRNRDLELGRLEACYRELAVGPSRPVPDIEASA